MSISQLLAWMQIAQLAAQAGLATEQQVAAWIQAKHGATMTEAEMNAALALIQNDATRRAALAQADATPQATTAA